jgi:tetratricopeptide (TPR) repeat protein
MKKLCLAALMFSGLAMSQQNSAVGDVKQAFNAGDDTTVVSLVKNIPETEMDAETYHYYTLALVSDDLDDAEEVAETAIEKFPDDYTVYQTHASVMGAQASDSIFGALGYAEKALNSLAKAVEVAPQETNAYFGLLGFHINAPSIAGGDLDEAEKIVQKITEMDGELGVIAQAQLARANDEDASPILKSAQTAYPNSKRILNYSANYYAREEQYVKAIEMYMALLQLPLTEEEAQDEDDVLRHNTRKLNAHYQIGRLSLESKQGTQNGIEHVEQFLSELDSNPVILRDLPSTNWANLRLAELYLNNNEKENAKALFAGVELEDEKRFKKAYKAVKKRLK